MAFIQSINEPLLDKRCFDEFSKVCLSHRFVRRGKSFFRINGNGVLQVLKYEYEPQNPHHDLSFGLLSMYGEMRPQWFTSGGCLVKHSIVNLVGQPNPILPSNQSAQYVPYTRRMVTPIEQLTILNDCGFPWLDSIDSQASLAEALCYLDTIRFSCILWNDELKFYPYLYEGDTTAAIKVMEAIIHQWDFALERQRQALSSEEFQIYSSALLEGKKGIFEKLAIAQRSDPEEIKNYLLRNLVQNKKLAKFCLPK